MTPVESVGKSQALQLASCALGAWDFPTDLRLKMLFEKAVELYMDDKAKRLSIMSPQAISTSHTVETLCHYGV